MVIDGNTKNRCIILLYYDRDGLVDRYVTGLLDALGNNASYVLVVVNGFITEEGERMLRAHAQSVLIRINTGFDVGGYREGLFWIGFERLSAYDEIVLMNYTFFAPLFPLEEMFRAMSGRDVDFWGITKHHNVPVDTTGGRIRYGHIPEHLNSHFLALRREFFLSCSYRDFIINMENPISYDSSISDYEAVFTKHFSDLGFRWDVYADSDEFEGVVYAPFMFEGGALIRKRCPIVKRRLFFGDYFGLLANSAGEGYSEAYRALTEETDYDRSLIWENLLRLQDRNAIRYAIHESYVADSEVSESKISANEAAVFILGSRQEADFLIGRYLGRIPEACDILYFDGVDFLCGESAEAEKISAAVGQYQYICLLSLRKEGETGSDTLSRLYGDCESLIGSSCQIENTVEIFRENSELGLLVPPMPSYGGYFETAEDGWYGRYEDVIEAAKALNFTFPILRGEMPPVFPAGGNYWARGDVLSEIIRSGMMQKAGCASDPELALLLLPYLFQERRFMTGTVTGTHYAAVQLTNLDYELRENNKRIFANIQPDAWWKVLDDLDTLPTDNG